MQGNVRFEEGPAGWLAHSNRYQLASQGQTREEARRRLEALEETMARVSASRIKALTVAFSDSE